MKRLISNSLLSSLAFAIAIALAVSVGMSAQEQPQNLGREHRATIITFDAPGAGTDTYQGTYAFSINPEGAIAGDYEDANNVYHGFLRTADGTFIESHQAACSNGAPVVSINPAEAVIGFCADAGNVFHAFLRTHDGRLTSFDAPGAGTDPGQGTFAGYFASINPGWDDHRRLP